MGDVANARLKSTATKAAPCARRMPRSRARLDTPAGACWECAERRGLNARDFAMEKGIVSEKYFDKETWFKLSYRQNGGSDFGAEPDAGIAGRGQGVAEATKERT